MDYIYKQGNSQNNKKNNIQNILDNIGTRMINEGSEEKIILIY